MEVPEVATSCVQHASGCGTELIYHQQQGATGKEHCTDSSLHHQSRLTTSLHQSGGVAYQSASKWLHCNFTVSVCAVKQDYAVLQMII